MLTLIPLYSGIKINLVEVNYREYQNYRTLECDVGTKNYTI